MHMGHHHMEAANRTRFLFHRVTCAGACWSTRVSVESIHGEVTHSIDIVLYMTHVQTPLLFASIILWRTAPGAHFQIR